MTAGPNALKSTALNDQPSEDCETEDEQQFEALGNMLFRMERTPSHFGHVVIDGRRAESDYVPGV